MTPEERQELKNLRQEVNNLRLATDPVFVAAVTRFIEVPSQLSDLVDVDTAGATADQVLKYGSGTGVWTPADDIDT